MKMQNSCLAGSAALPRSGTPAAAALAAVEQVLRKARRVVMLGKGLVIGKLSNPAHDCQPTQASLEKGHLTAAPCFPFAQGHREMEWR